MVFRLFKLAFSFLPPRMPGRILDWMMTILLFRKPISVILSLVLPKSVDLPEGKLLLNRCDPYVSGSIAFGFFEPKVVERYRRELKAGMTVVDIGANIGFYTIIAANRVGPTGHVYAFEPHPENVRWLRRSVEVNCLQNVTIEESAVSAVSGRDRLFLSRTNPGDHQIYGDNSEKRQSFEIKITNLDEYFPSTQIVDVIKMDIQGAEGFALQGMKKLIERSPSLILFMEFWPEGLKRTGSSVEDVFSNLQQWFSLQTIDASGQQKVIADLAQLLSEISDDSHLNILGHRRFKIS